MRATDYPVGGATRAAVLAIGRQARTVYAFRTFPRVAAARPSAPRVPHYLPTSATDVVDDDDYAGEDGSGGYQHRGTTRRRRAESLRTVRLEPAARVGDFFFYLIEFVFFRCRSCVLFPASARSLARAYLLAPLSVFISFTLVSYFACCSSLRRLDCFLFRVSARSCSFLLLSTSIVVF